MVSCELTSSREPGPLLLPKAITFNMEKKTTQACSHQPLGSLGRANAAGAGEVAEYGSYKQNSALWLTSFPSDPHCVGSLQYEMTPAFPGGLQRASSDPS